MLLIRARPAEVRIPLSNSTSSEQQQFQHSWELKVLAQAHPLGFSTIRAAEPEPTSPVPHTDRTVLSPKPVNTSLYKTTPTAGGAAAPAPERTSDAEEDGNCVVQQGEVQGAQGSGLV